MNPFMTWYRGLPRVLRALVTVNVVLYVLYLLVFQWVGVLEAAAHQFLALTPTGSGVLRAPWTLLTYGVTHLGGGLGGFLQVLFNVLILLWVGEEMERMLGGTWLLVAYFASTLGGALAALAVAAVPGMAAPGYVFGANAAVLGVMMATATRYPYKTVSLLFLGNVRLLYVVAGLLVLALLLSGPFHFLFEVGGVAVAFLYGVAEKRGHDLHTWAAFLAGEQRRESRTQRAKPPREARMPQMPWRQAEPEGAATPRRRATQAEVDRILDKISAQGKTALTPEERRILDEYSRR